MGSTMKSVREMKDEAGLHTVKAIEREKIIQKNIGTKNINTTGYK